MTRLLRFIDRYENMPISFGLWLSTALFIIFVRSSIESMVVTRTFPIANAFHLLHTPIFFLSLLLSIIIVVHFLAKTEIQKVSKIALLLFPVIIFPALLDFIVTGFTKANITYKYITDNLWPNVVRVFNPAYTIPGVPLSLRLEVSLIIIMAFGYILLKRKKIFPALTGALLVYIACFLYGSLPAVLIEIFKLVIFTVKTLRLKNFFILEGVIDVNTVVLLELLFISFLALIWLWRYDRTKYYAILKNVRPTRSFHYILLCLLGVFANSLEAPVKDFFMLIRIAGTLLAVFLAVQFSVIFNDIFDVECDRISNATRPLVIQALDRHEYLNIGYVCLTLSLLLAYWVNETCVMVTLLAVAFSFLYSAPPLRLKRFFPISSFIIGLQAALAFAMGVVAVGANDTTQYFPASFFWPLFIIFSLGSNIKDLKDIKGDKQAGIVTLPVLLGEKNGRNLVAFLVFLSYCLVPYFLRSLFPEAKVLVLSLCFALVNFVYIRKKNSQEKVIFLVYFIYIILLVLLVR